MVNLITEHINIWTAAQLTKSVGAGRGNGSNNVNLYGIKKLRELILDLAVRGKLVSQDPNDEPAGVLLEKISQKKAKLIKEGKIKKERPLPKVREDEIPFDLPKSWEWARLGDITNYGMSDKVEPGNANSDTWILELEDVEKGSSKLLRKVRCLDRKYQSSKNKFHRGDVVYGKLRPYLDKVIIADEDGICTTEMIPLKGYLNLTTPFIRLIMKSPYFIDYANKSTHGMNLPRLGTDKARLAPIPLTSENEQKRIVAKVDELMVLCDQLEQQQTDSNATHQTLVETLLAALTSAANPSEFNETWQLISEHFENLFTTEQSIDKLKQTILQLAVKGKLVPQDPNDEPACILLEKIAKEKARLIKAGKIGKEKTPPKVLDERIPFDLPQSWEWVRFGELVNSRLGKMLDKAKNKGAMKPYLRNSNVHWDRFDLTDLKRMKLEDYELDEFKVKYGDLLVCEGGEPGRCAIWRETNADIYFQKALHRVRPLCGILPEYLQMNLMNDASNGNLSQYFTGATIKHLPGDKLALYILPLPPVNEQLRIVSKISELMTLCERLKIHLKEGQSTKVQLADSIVKQAVA